MCTPIREWPLSRPCFPASSSQVVGIYEMRTFKFGRRSRGLEDCNNGMVTQNKQKLALAPLVRKRHSNISEYLMDCASCITRNTILGIHIGAH